MAPADSTRAGVVLLREGSVALIRRQRGARLYYAFPGDAFENFETPVDAARRVAKEELGLEVAVGPLLALITFRGEQQNDFVAHEMAGLRHGFGHRSYWLGASGLRHLRARLGTDWPSGHHRRLAKAPPRPRRARSEGRPPELAHDPRGPRPHCVRVDLDASTVPLRGASRWGKP